MKTNLDKDFPSLRIGYEAVKDSLNNQRQVVQDYINRAITLLSIATAVIGIGVPLLYAQNITKLYLFKPYIPLTTLSAVPILAWGVAVYYSCGVLKKESLTTIDNPSIIKDEFVTLTENKFYSDMIQHIDNAFKENEKIVKRKADNLRPLVWWVIIETVMVVLLAIAFSALA